VLQIQTKKTGRTSINRSYYAAYHVACHALVSSHHKAGHHKHIWSSLKNAMDHELKVIGVKGDNLYKRRIKADYKVEATISSATAVRAIVEAEQLIREIDAQSAIIASSVPLRHPWIKRHSKVEHLYIVLVAALLVIFLLASIALALRP